MPLKFEWDKPKAETNFAKHSDDFENATTIFADALSLTIPDPVHSEFEQRFITIGNSYAGKLLVVAHTERGENIRVISARPASRKERKRYEERS